eukprot:gene1530-59_t
MLVSGPIGLLGSVLAGMLVKAHVQENDQVGFGLSCATCKAVVEQLELRMASQAKPSTKVSSDLPDPYGRYKGALVLEETEHLCDFSTFYKKVQTLPPVPWEWLGLQRHPHQGYEYGPKAMERYCRHIINNWDEHLVNTFLVQDLSMAERVEQFCWDEAGLCVMEERESCNVPLEDRPLSAHDLSHEQGFARKQAIVERMQQLGGDDLSKRKDTLFGDPDQDVDPDSSCDLGTESGCSQPLSRDPLRTHLHRAVSGGNIQLVGALLAGGADPHAEDSKGVTPKKLAKLLNLHQHGKRANQTLSRTADSLQDLLQSNFVVSPCHAVQHASPWLTPPASPVDVMATYWAWAVPQVGVDTNALSLAPLESSSQAPGLLATKAMKKGTKLWQVPLDWLPTVPVTLIPNVYCHQPWKVPLSVSMSSYHPKRRKDTKGPPTLLQALFAALPDSADAVQRTGAFAAYLAHILQAGSITHAPMLDALRVRLALKYRSSMCWPLKDLAQSSPYIFNTTLARRQEVMSVYQLVHPIAAEWSAKHNRIHIQGSIVRGALPLADFLLVYDLASSLQFFDLVKEQWDVSLLLPVSDLVGYGPPVVEFQFDNRRGTQTAVLKQDISAGTRLTSQRWMFKCHEDGFV